MSRKNNKKNGNYFKFGWLEFGWTGKNKKFENLVIIISVLILIIIIGLFIKILLLKSELIVLIIALLVEKRL